MQLRDVGEEEYLALGGARVVLDLDLHHRIAGPAARETGHDLLPPRRRRPQERLDAAPGIARQTEPLRPRDVDQRARVGAEDAAGGGIGEDDAARCIHQHVARPLHVQDREQVVVAAPYGPIETIAVERDLDRRAQVALVEGLDDVAVRGHALRPLERLGIGERGDEDDGHGELGTQLLRRGDPVGTVAQGDVHEDQVGPHLGRQRQGARSRVGGADDLVSEPAQPILDVERDDGLVLDDQDACRLRRVHGSAPGEPRRAAPRRRGTSA